MIWIPIRSPPELESHNEAHLGWIQPVVLSSGCVFRVGLPGAYGLCVPHLCNLSQQSHPLLSCSP